MVKDKRIIDDSIKDPSCIFKEESKGNVRCTAQSILRKEHQQKNDLEKSSQGCENTKGIKYSVILHKTISDQRTVGGHWDMVE